MEIKSLIRETLIRLKLDVSKNIKYDRLTRKIIRQFLNPTDNCIDIGAHKGEIIEEILKSAPRGQHMAIEPIPEFYELLKEKFENQIRIFPFAISDQNGPGLFQHVKNAPAYSGLKKRAYDVSNPDIEKIEVELRRLDEIIPSKTRIHFIKIDVEGAELQVLKGAQSLLAHQAPILLFEFGKGASEFYGTTPEKMFDFLCKTLHYRIFTLESFIQSGLALTDESFFAHYEKGTEYYFVAKK